MLLIRGRYQEAAVFERTKRDRLFVFNSDIEVCPASFSQETSTYLDMIPYETISIYHDNCDVGLAW